MAVPCSCSAVLPPLLVVFVVSFVYFVFHWTFFYPQIITLAHYVETPDPQYINTGPLWFIILCGVIFNLTFWHMVWAFLSAMFTSPGEIPTTPRWKSALFNIPPDRDQEFLAVLENTDKEPQSTLIRDLVLLMPVVERKKNGQYRFCAVCDVYKPDRAHHCKICNKCVLRMDHHCPWIANCVGFGNHKFFMQFLFYCVISAILFLLVMFTRLMRAFRPVLSWTYFLGHDLLVVLGYVFCVFIAIALGTFLSVHIIMALGGMTTIEYKEKKSVAEMEHRFRIAHQKFDRGPWKNWLHVMGPFWAWWWPIQTRSTNDEGCYDFTIDNEPPETTCCGPCGTPAMPKDPEQDPLVEKNNDSHA